ncbi:MAG: hypothetical protein LBS36_10750 [Oscillospiraceae bacterium]|nr:hypothetical protein [Oscillospiraceae bacterium]
MGYYGRDYLWLTPANATIEEARGIIMWSIAQGRPVVMEWPGGIPEFNVVTGYADSGETLIGFTYCEECAAKKNDYGMFVNPARWGEPWGNGNSFRILVIGDKVKPTVSDCDTIQYALNVLNKNEADDKEFFLTREFIAGDAAFGAWLEACDNTENTARLFAQTDMYSYALYMNTIYAQSCILPYYKKLGARNNRRVNDIAIQIDIALSRMTNERKQLDEATERGENFAAMCREHVKNLKHHREYMRGWLRELISEISKQKKKQSETSKPDKKKNDPRHALLAKVIPALIYNEDKDKGFVQGFHYDENTADGRFLRNNYQPILQAAAEWHTAFWENTDAFEKIGLDWRFETKENLTAHISMMEKDFKKYEKNEKTGKIPKVWKGECAGTPFRFENNITPEQLGYFTDAVERLKNEYWPLAESRFHTGRNITVIHGDMHPGTINVPKTSDKTVKFDALQVVRMGLPTEDLAMLIALHIEPDRQKAQPLLDFYYHCLCECVKDYSCEAFMNDYKISVMENMFFTIRLINRGIYDFKMRDNAIRAFETFVLKR